MNLNTWKKTTICGVLIVLVTVTTYGCNYGNQDVNYQVKKFKENSSLQVKGISMMGFAVTDKTYDPEKNEIYFCENFGYYPPYSNVNPIDSKELSEQLSLEISDADNIIWRAKFGEEPSVLATSQGSIITCMKWYEKLSKLLVGYRYSDGKESGNQIVCYNRNMDIVWILNTEARVDSFFGENTIGASLASGPFSHIPSSGIQPELADEYGDMNYSKLIHIDSNGNIKEQEYMGDKLLIKEGSEPDSIQLGAEGTVESSGTYIARLSADTRELIWKQGFRIEELFSYYAKPDANSLWCFSGINNIYKLNYENGEIEFKSSMTEIFNKNKLDYSGYGQILNVVLSKSGESVYVIFKMIYPASYSGHRYNYCVIKIDPNKEDASVYCIDTKDLGIVAYTDVINDKARFLIINEEDKLLYRSIDLK